MDRKPNQAGTYKRKKRKKKESDRCCKTNQVGTQVEGDDQNDENYIDAATNTREGYLVFSLGKGTDAAANTREVTSFLVWAKGQMQRLTREKLSRFQFGHTKKEKIEKEENPKKKVEKRKIQKKNRKRKIQKQQKRKNPKKYKIKNK